MKAEAHAYAETLRKNIERIKKHATTSKLRWNTTYVLPSSDFSVDANTELKWDFKTNTDSVASKWWDSALRDQ